MEMSERKKSILAGYVVGMIILAVVDIVAGFKFGHDLVPYMSNFAEAITWVVVLVLGLIIIAKLPIKDKDDEDFDEDDEE